MSDELQLQFLGGLGLTRNGIPLRGFLSAKVQALLCYLAVTGRAHSREALMALLWGDMPEERADHGLRQALSNLQKLVGTHVTVTRHAVAFNQDVPYKLDIELFLLFIKQAESSTLRPHRRLREAVDLYAGDFLDGFYVRDAPEFEEWAAGQREWLRQMLLDALHRLAIHDISRGEYRAAAGHLERLLSLDPWREDAHRQLMLLLAYEGRRDAATAQYHVCRRLLLENLGEEPAAETTELYRQIREGIIELPAPQVPPGNLPANLPPIIGRQAELEQIEALLDDPSCRMLTLMGPGGVGKTRLALQTARNLAGEFKHGAFFVSLSPVRDPSLVLNTIAGTLDIEESPGHTLIDSLNAAMRDKEMLLVLDNFEHLMSAASLVAELLGVAPQVRLLVTSRARLRLRNEQVYEVAPLALPPLDDPALPEVVSRFPSVAMFAERAIAARPGFAVTDANARAVAEICNRLEGLPLAIELAAARLSMMPAQALLARLEKRLGVLTGGARDLPTRQQTLRATLEWSYDLLTETQQALFRTLAVFAGGCTLNAIEDICAAGDIVRSTSDMEVSVLETLSALVDNSLLLREEQAGEDVRFRMLETVREYGLERLIASGGEERAWRLHAENYLRLAQSAQSELRGPNQLEWLTRLDADHNNLRLALRWARNSRDDPRDDSEAESGLAQGMRAAAGLCRFWEMRGYITEGRQWLDELLAQPGPSSPPARAIALRGAGILALGQGDLARSAVLCEESLGLYRQMGDAMGLAGAFNSLGNARRELGDLDEAEALYKQGLEIYRELKDPLGIAVVLNNFASMTQNRGDLERAVELYEESLEIRRASNDTRGIAYTLNKLGEVAHQQGNFVRAEALCRESLQQRRDLADKHGTVLTLTTLGAVMYDLGDDAQATLLMQESLALGRELGETWGIASALRILGSIARRRGEYKEARELYEESLSLFKENGDTRGASMVLADLGEVAREQQG